MTQIGTELSGTGWQREGSAGTAERKTHATIVRLLFVCSQSAAHQRQRALTLGALPSVTTQ